MVLAETVGKPRAPARGVALAALTFGVYGYHWDIQSHNELYHQYELKRERRTEGLSWYTIGTVIPVLKLVYFFLFMDNVRYVQDRLAAIGRNTRRIPVGGVLTCFILALIGLYLLVPIGAGVLTAGLGEEGNVDDERLVLLGGTLAAAGILIYLALRVTGYLIIQSHVNSLWKIHFARIESMRTAPAQ